jgi:DNA-binding CsgD family transcriptional regulator
VNFFSRLKAWVSAEARTTAMWNRQQDEIASLRRRLNDHNTDTSQITDKQMLDWVLENLSSIDIMQILELDRPLIRREIRSARSLYYAVTERKKKRGGRK